MKTIRELKLSNKAWSDEMRERKKDYLRGRRSARIRK